MKELDSMRNQQIERRLNQLGSMVKGNQDFQADRIADVIEQIDEVRNEVKELTERFDVMAKWIKANLKKKDDEQ
jgi:ubiquinone biosynthesis protein UbiJ|tara:strand:+ start:137 stop:358 length:222 start_codon:yes stop_codon:yes gene_type:complete